MAAVTIRRRDWAPAIRAVPAGEAIAVVGDVHGQDDLFAALTEALGEELSGATRATFVQLGDIVDRGPGALSALRRAKAGLPGVGNVTLMGNHEELMLAAMLGDEPGAAGHWLFSSGGAETLASAGVDPADFRWRAAFRSALGEELWSWLCGLPQLHREGDLVFVHAGLDPSAPLSAQDARTLMWTRSPWLESPGPYDQGVAAIHGHTPQPDVDLSHRHRINLDTGAFRTGVLSGLVIAGDRMRVVQAAR